MRRFVLPLALALSFSLAGLWLIRAHRAVQPSDQQAIASASASLDSLFFEGPAAASSDAIVVASGYLERLRLGLSNPFRLVAFALRDPRLDAVGRRRVGLALLARLQRGDAYLIDPLVFGTDGSRDRALLEMIDRAVRSRPDPRVGELAVRLAFTMAAARTTIGFRDASVAIQVAALLRDRELARRDLDAVLRRAARDHKDVVDEIVRSRAARELEVERPSLSNSDASVQRLAIAAAPSLMRQLEHLEPVAELPVRRPSLRPTVASRLAELALAQPPESPVVIALTGARRLSLTATGPISTTPSLPVVTNEEGVAAFDGYFTTAPASERAEAARLVLASAVSLRVLSQQTPWFAGDGERTPTAAQLQTRYGLREVTFDSRVPGVWRPFYRRELASALADMKRVLPRMSTTGLAVSFGVDGLPDSALAMHEPSTRTLRLSIYTSGGTLAHELAHDLDWQAARRLYADGIGYSTDRAVRAPRAAGWPSTMRPTEVFARGTDWLIASALARQGGGVGGGRSNGFLSAVQDAVLTGFAAGPPTIAGPVATRSAVAALRTMTFVPDSVEAGLERQWADPNSTDPMLLVRTILEAPMPWRAAWRISRNGSAVSAGDHGLRLSSALAVCAEADMDTAPATHLLMLAATARARGALVRRAAGLAFSSRPAWAHSVVGDAPWAANVGDQMVQALGAALVAQTARGGEVAPLVPELFRHQRCDSGAIMRSAP